VSNEGRDATASMPPATSPVADEAPATQDRGWPRHEERSDTSEADIAVPLPIASPRAAAEAPTAAESPVTAGRAAPALPQFELPTHELEQLADGAGLLWVQSDADKVRNVQQAIAAEPQPMHVPRERKAVVLPDEGPLVLVETRKDLSQLGLPFERQAAGPAQPSP